MKCAAVLVRRAVLEDQSATAGDFNATLGLLTRFSRDGLPVSKSLHLKALVAQVRAGAAPAAPRLSVWAADHSNPHPP